MLELLPPFYFLTFAKVSKKFGLKKVSVLVSKTFGLEKSLGIGLENIWSRKKVSVSVSKIFGLKKSLGLENFGLEKKFRYRSRWNFLVSSLSAHGKIIDRGGLCDRLFKTQKFANHMRRQPHSSGSCQLWGGAPSTSQNISPFSFSVLGDKGQIYSHGDGCNFFSSVGSSRNCTT